MTRDSLIQVNDLKKHYNHGAIKALDGVTVDINEGDVMVVIGPSGSGKSTFLRSLNLLEVPTSGSIVFDGVDITSMADLTSELDKHAEGDTVTLTVVRYNGIEEFLNYYGYSSGASSSNDSSYGNYYGGYFGNYPYGGYYGGRGNNNSSNYTGSMTYETLEIEVTLEVLDN